MTAPDRRWPRFTLRTLFVVVTIACVGPTGCGHETAPKTSTPSPDLQQRRDADKALTRAEIEAIAVAALVKRASNHKDRIIDSYRDGTDWYVTVTWLPETPGGHTTVVVSESGEIKEIIGGA